MTYLVNAIVHDQPLDVPTIIIHKMITEAERRSSSIALPFGLLIMHIIHFLGNHISPSQDYEKPRGNISDATLKHMNQFATHDSRFKKAALSTNAIMQAVLVASKFMVTNLCKLEQKVDRHDRNQLAIACHLQSRGAQLELDTKPPSPLLEFHFRGFDAEGDQAGDLGL